MTRSVSVCIVVLALVAAGALFVAPRAQADSGGAPPGTPAQIALQHVSAGYSSTCAITVSAEVRCWGLWNEETNTAPFTVSGFSGTPDVISTGDQSACVILTNGDVECWGQNPAGQLGDGSTTDSATPVKVVGLAGRATAIAMQELTGCALLESGTVQCWGLFATPAVAGGPYASVSAGFSRICMTTAGGDAFCAVDGEAPQSVGLPGEQVAVVSPGGRATCGLNATGVVNCIAPYEGLAELVSDATSIDVGNDGACASLTSGEVACWPLRDGFNFDQGLVGEWRTYPIRGVPETVEGIEGAVAVTMGTAHACAVLVSGAVRCWGQNHDGQTTDPDLTTLSSPVPIRMGGSIRVTGLAAGDDHSCLVSQGGVTDPRVSCVGSRLAGQVGPREAGLARTPTRPVGPEQVSGIITSLDARGNATCAVRDRLDVVCWGSGGVLQFRDTVFPDAAPARIFTRESTRQISLGGSHACIRVSSADDDFGQLRCFGENAEGQVNGSPGPEVRTSVQPELPANTVWINEVATGASHTCARITREIRGVATTGVWCWGNPIDGRTGRSSTGANLRLISGFTPISLAAGSAHTCAVRTEGRVACWGANLSGQLGNGTMTAVEPEGQAQLVSGLTGVSKVFAGLNHTCAIHDSGSSISCWGEGDSGQLGDGSMADSSVPVSVALPPGQNWTSMALGWQHTCALSQTDLASLAWCWGEGENGELGNLAVVRTPVAIPGLQVATGSEPVECDGKQVTIFAESGSTTFGTAGDDVIWGTDGNDDIQAGSGNDTVCGRGGDDQISGESGNDILFGGDGLDFIFGGDGNDEMVGGEGNDRIRGNQGVDTIFGGPGNDFLYGGVDGDTINGGDGNDTIGGFGGNDTINGGPGRDIVFGGFGADTINGGDGNDTVNGLIGDDIINGGAGDDVLNGDQGQDVIHGDSGNDTVNGGNSLDRLFGDDGNDAVNGGKANDWLSGGTGTDTCTGNLGTDTADSTCERTFGIP